MVQIITPNGNLPTSRQQALDQGVQNMVGGFDRMQRDNLQAEQTQRQQAINNIKTANDLRGQGYNVTPDMVEQAINPSKKPESGLSSIGRFFTGEKAHTQERPNLYDEKNKIPGFKTEQQKNQEEKDRSDFKEAVSLGKETGDYSHANKLGKRIHGDDFEIKPTNWENSPEGKKFQAQEAIKARYKADASKEMTPYQKAMVGIKENAPPKQEKIGAEEKKAIALSVNGLEAIDGMEQAMKDGHQPQYIDSNTPGVGGIISDTPFTVNQRLAAENFGRLNSGGAINKDEEKRFMAAGPRPSDSPEIIASKLQKQKDMFRERAAIYAPGGAQAAIARTQAPQMQVTPAPSHPQVNEALQWAQQNPNDPRSAEIIKRAGAK